MYNYFIKVPTWCETFLLISFEIKIGFFLIAFYKCKFISRTGVISVTEKELSLQNIRGSGDFYSVPPDANHGRSDRDDIIASVSWINRN